MEHDREELTFLGPTFSVNNTRFCQDGSCLAIIFGNAVPVRALATGRETQVLRGQTTSIVGITFAPDGRRLATISMDLTVREWNVSPCED